MNKTLYKPSKTEKEKGKTRFMLIAARWIIKHSNA
jgi:hypothetical protein